MAAKMLAPVPPMGWNSWNTFSEEISDELIRTTADAMADSGLLDAGYNYLIIDDCWALRERDENGKLVPDPVKFPHGMKDVADYVHSKGLKFGMYSCCGTMTCAGYPSSFEHEASDAQQFADWGVDYLKYDNCYKPRTIASPMLYRRMGLALKATGRDIVYAACQWGTEDVHTWIRSSGAHTFRSTGDIRDSWASMEEIARSQLDKLGYGAPDCWNDMDMLIVGMHGKSTNSYIAIGGCTDTEYQTHFALWALMNSPLIIGCDIRSMTEETKKILLNKEVISINQDPEGRSAYKIDGNAPDTFILAKHLADGSIALGYFNFSDTEQNVSLDFWDLGLAASANVKLNLRDCINHKDLGVKAEVFTAKVPAHGCCVYTARQIRG